MEIVKKAYNVWIDSMIGYEPEHYYSLEDTPVIYAETASKAKTKFSIDDNVSGKRL